MGLKIADLLKWRTSVILLDADGNPVLDDDEKPVVVYLRIIGDNDLEEAHRQARIHSAKVRKELQDSTSDMFQDRVLPIMEASREDCIGIIMQYRTSNLDAESRANTVRPELATIDEVAVDADAPTLEEQEQLDTENDRVDNEYTERLKEYVETRTAVIRAELDELSDEEINKIATEEISGVLALAEFFTVLMEQKILRASYLDKTYKEKAFSNLEEVRETSPTIRQQLFDAYLELEYDPDKVKK